MLTFLWFPIFNQQLPPEFFGEGSKSTQVDKVRGSEGRGNFIGQGQSLVGGRRVGGSGERGPRRRKKFKIFLVKTNENYNFKPIFHNFNENYAIFTKFSRFFAKNCEKIQTCIHKGFGELSPRRLPFYSKMVQKAIVTSYFLKIFINYERKFDFQKLIYIKIKVLLMAY